MATGTSQLTPDQRAALFYLDNNKNGQLTPQELAFASNRISKALNKEDIPRRIDESSPWADYGYTQFINLPFLQLLELHTLLTNALRKNTILYYINGIDKMAGVERTSGINLDEEFMRNLTPLEVGTLLNMGWLDHNNVNDGRTSVYRSFREYVIDMPLATQWSIKPPLRIEYDHSSNRLNLYVNKHLELMLNPALQRILSYADLSNLSDDPILMSLTGLEKTPAKHPEKLSFYRKGDPQTISTVEAYSALKLAEILVYKIGIVFDDEFKKFLNPNSETLKGYWDLFTFLYAPKSIILAQAREILRENKIAPLKVVGITDFSRYDLLDTKYLILYDPATGHLHQGKSLKKVAETGTLSH